MINKLWVFLIIAGICISILTGNINELGNIILNSSTDAFSIFSKMALLILFWGGLFNIAIESGLISNLTRFLKKPLGFLFPEIPKDSLALEYITGNMIANLLGLGAAATPLGLKAFEEMQKMNPNKKVPTRSMITFIVINASSLTLFPTTIISLRVFYGGVNDMPLILMMILTTTISTTLAIIIDRILYALDRKKSKK